MISKTRHWRKRALFFGLLVCAGILFAAPRPKHPDKILIEKSKRTLTLLNYGEVLKTYKVALGSQPIGPKDRQGDHKTPEGLYYVDRKVPNSTFYKALHLTYPSPADIAHAKKLGLSPSGDVEIHGLGAKIRLYRRCPSRLPPTLRAPRPWTYERYQLKIFIDIVYQ